MTIVVSYAEAILRLGSTRIYREGLVPKTDHPKSDLRRLPERVLNPLPMAPLNERHRYHVWYRLQSGQLREQFGAATNREASFLVVDAEQAGPDWNSRPETRAWMKRIIDESGVDSIEKFSCYWTDSTPNPAGFIVSWGSVASVQRHYPNAVIALADQIR